MDERYAGLDCIDVPAVVQESLAGGSNEWTMTPLGAAAVNSPDFTGDAYFVAMRYEVDGEQNVGVWLATNLDGEGPYLAVDGFAKQFTDWPDADKGQFDVSPADPAGKRARNCLG